MVREGKRRPQAAESSPRGLRGLIQQLTARERMRGLSLVEVEVLRSDWFISMLNSSRSTFSTAWGSDSITFHMAMATLQRQSPSPPGLCQQGHPGVWPG